MKPTYHGIVTVQLQVEKEKTSEPEPTFFENQFIRLKFSNLLKPLGTIIQQNYWSFLPLELIYFALFTMRHPVVPVLHKVVDLDSFLKMPKFKRNPFSKHKDLHNLKKYRKKCSKVEKVRPQSTPYQRFENLKRE